jgi:hypothetical protein
MAILTRRDCYWLGACAASYALGVGWGTSAKLPESSRELASSTQAGGSQAGPAGRNGILGTPSPVAAATRAAGPISKTWLQSYQIFSTCRDPLNRQRMLAEALAGIDESNWESAWDPMWKSRKDGRISEEEWKLFMQKFGSVGRERLAEKGRPDDVVNGWETWNVRHGIVGWATEDVGGSWDWISKQPEGKYRKGLMTGWFEAAAAMDPDRALAAMDQLDPDKDRNIWNMVAGRMAKHDPEKVRDWLATLSAQPAKEKDPNRPDPTRWDPQPKGWVDGIYRGGPANGEQLAQGFFSQMLGEKMAINGDPAYAATLKPWFDTFTGSAALPGGAMGNIASTLMQSQPAGEVLAWIETHPASAGTFHASANTVSQWTNEQTADEVAARLKAHRDSPAYDGAAAGFAAKAHAFDPEGALIWANTIKDETQRQSLLNSWKEK